MKKNEIKQSIWKTEMAKVLYFVVGLFVVAGVGAYWVFSSMSDNTAAAPIVGSGPAQEILMKVTRSSYEPSSFTIKAGQPVRWMVDGTEARGCTKYLLAQDVGISKSLSPGINVFEFTPTKKGTIGFQCSMGMVRGQFQVV